MSASETNGMTPEQDEEETVRDAAERDAAAELEDRLKRVEAEFVNETRRSRRKADEDRRYAAEKVVIDLLPVFDALHSARDGLGEGDAAECMRAGLDLIEKQMAGVLERHGVSRIEALGQAFDPARHQAIMMIERAESEPHTVCEVLRPGYDLNGRVVRPAEVVVVKPPPAPEGTEAPTEPETGAPESTEGAEESD